MALKINVKMTGSRSEGREVSKLDNGDVFYGEIVGINNDAEALYLKVSNGFVRLSPEGGLHEHFDSFNGPTGGRAFVRNYRSVKATLNVGE